MNEGKNVTVPSISVLQSVNPAAVQPPHQPHRQLVALPTANCQLLVFSPLLSLPPDLLFLPPCRGSARRFRLFLSIHHPVFSLPSPASLSVRPPPATDPSFPLSQIVICFSWAPLSAISHYPPPIFGASNFLLTFHLLGNHRGYLSQCRPFAVFDHSSLLLLVVVFPFSFLFRT